MSTSPNAATGLVKVADTGAAGFNLQNATPTILTWTAPNDGQVHRVTIVASQHVTVAETGGQVVMNAVLPDGFAVQPGAFPGGGAAGASSFTGDRTVQPGSVVNLAQLTALTVGAAVVWAQIWAA